MPSLVRIPNDSATETRNALDAGATGLLVPHVTRVEQTQRIVELAHFGEGGRGLAGSTQAACFTTRSMFEHLEFSEKETTNVLQIEDLAALDNVDAIAGAEGVYGLFMGRADLAVAMQHGVNDAAVLAAVKGICQACDGLNLAVGMFTPDASEVPMWMACGASFFPFGLDHAFLLNGAKALKQTISPD